MFNQLLAAQAPEGGALGALGSLIWFIPVIAVMYFMMIRPQKKREKAIQDMRSKIEVGDEIVTSGGIIGLVVSIKEESLMIETGSDRSKIRIAKWAVQANNTVHDNVEPAK